MTKLNLKILTRVTRPNNLLKIRSSIFDSVPTGIEVDWFIIFDTAKVESISAKMLDSITCKNTRLYFTECGDWSCQYQKINEMMSSGCIGEGYVHLIDDDNILHPNFYESVLGAWYENQSAGGFIVSQKVDGKDFTGLDIRVASPNNIKVGGIDLAQYIFRSDIPSKYGVEFGTGYCGDGDFIVDLFERGAESEFIFIDQVLCYYNYLA